MQDGQWRVLAIGKIDSADVTFEAFIDDCKMGFAAAKSACTPVLAEDGEYQVA